MHSDLIYLSQKVAEDTYGVLRIDLDNDLSTPIVMFANTDHIDPASMPFSEATQKTAASGAVHSDDVELYLHVLSVDNLRVSINRSSDRVSLWYRHKTGNDYTWIDLEVIAAQDFSPANRQVLMYIRNGDVRPAFESNPAMYEEFQQLKALSDVYMSVHLINLKTGDFSELKATPYITEITSGKGAPQEVLSKCMDRLVVREQQDQVQAFVDLSSLDERMGGRSFFSQEFTGVHYGWFCAQFIAVSRDEHGSLDSVYFTTQVVDAAKRREENLLRITYTDELTMLNNRRSYEEDVKRYKESGLVDDLHIIAADINGLKVVNDDQGHAAGDELIRGAAWVLLSCLGHLGKVYRMGGDEFVAIVLADGQTLANAIQTLDEVTGRWSGEKVKSLSLAHGMTGVSEFPDKSIEELAVIADRRMYDAKARHYQESGNDRRRR